MQLSYLARTIRLGVAKMESKMTAGDFAGFFLWNENAYCIRYSIHLIAGHIE